MKKLISITFVLLASSGNLLLAQGYTLSTNLTMTNTIAASSTLTYSGANVLDLTRYQTFFITATGCGTNTATNTLTFTFLASPTGTNWEATPRYALTGTVCGTNPFTFTTNLACLDVGYLKPFQITNSVANDLTNVWTFGGLKTYPRN